MSAKEYRTERIVSGQLPAALEPKNPSGASIGLVLTAETANFDIRAVPPNSDATSPPASLIMELCK